MVSVFLQEYAWHIGKNLISVVQNIYKRKTEATFQ